MERPNRSLIAVPCRVPRADQRARCEDGVEVTLGDRGDRQRAELGLFAEVKAAEPRQVNDLLDHAQHEVDRLDGAGLRIRRQPIGDPGLMLGDYRPDPVAHRRAADR